MEGTWGRAKCTNLHLGTPVSCHLQPDTDVQEIKTYQTILVSRHVDTDDLLKTEVPDKVGVDEWCNETSRGGIDYRLSVGTQLETGCRLLTVNWAVDVALN